MFDSEFCKNKARESLHQRFWGAVGTVFLFGLLGGIPRYLINTITGYMSGTETPKIEDLEGLKEYLILFYSRPETLLGLVLTFIATFLFIYPMTAGLNRYFLSLIRVDYATVGDLFSRFSDGYGKTVSVMFLLYIKKCLWSLLLIVPGIIKTYEYMIIPYILAFNPHLSHKRYFEIAHDAMKGFKFKLFCLQLSFIGWWLLAILVTVVTCGLGVTGMFFLMPYIYASYAAFFDTVMKYAVNNGIATAEEFGLTKYPSQDVTGGGGNVFSWQEE